MGVKSNGQKTEQNVKIFVFMVSNVPKIRYLKKKGQDIQSSGPSPMVVQVQNLSGKKVQCLEPEE